MARVDAHKGWIAVLVRTYAGTGWLLFQGAGELESWLRWQFAEIAGGRGVVYGLGRFPVTLYQELWLTLLALGDDIRHFIRENEAKLKKE